MHIITPGNKDFMKFFSLPKEKENNSYCFSVFLLKQETEEGILLCNTVTGELILLSWEEVDTMNQTLPEMSQITQSLIRHRFLVPQNIREDETVDQLRFLFLKRREAKNIITNYTILPTTFCNARCFYCYESGIRHVHMSEETANQLVRFITEKHGDAPVKLDWFGGEPLLGKQRIDQICHGLDERCVSYTSRMTSNGYLFDDNLVRHAQTAWQLKEIQITLDGTEEVYNRSKAYVNSRENAYQRVLRNIGLLIEEGIHVNIRLNMDDHNEKDLEILIRELSERFSERSNLTIYVSRLNEDVGFAPIQHDYGAALFLNDRLAQLQTQLEDYGWPRFSKTKLPCLHICYCIADDPCSILCTPDGILSKCEDYLYEDTVGNLAEGVTNQEKITWWRQRVGFEGCEVCPLYPSCTQLLKHCPLRKTECNTDHREQMIAGYKNLMLREYKKWKNSEE